MSTMLSSSYYICQVLYLVPTNEKLICIIMYVKRFYECQNYHTVQSEVFDKPY